MYEPHEGGTPPPDLRAERRCFSRIGLSLFLLYALTLLFVGVAAFLIGRFAPHLLREINFTVALSFCAQYLLGMPVACLVLRSLPGQAPPSRPFGVKNGLRAFLIALGLMYAGSLVSQLLMRLLTHMGASDANALDEIITQADERLLIVLMLVLAPIFEELVFRKLLIDRLHPFGERFAMVFSGVTFGLIHGNFHQFFYACALGMLLAYLYLQTGRLRYPILLHMLINFQGSVVALRVLEMLQSSLVSENITGLVLAGLYALVVFIGALVGLVLLARALNRITFVQGVCALPRGKRLTTIVCNPGMLLFAAITVYLFASSLR